MAGSILPPNAQEERKTFWMSRQSNKAKFILSENTTQHQIGATKKSPNVKRPNGKKSETKIGAQSGPDSPPQALGHRERSPGQSG